MKRLSVAALSAALALAVGCGDEKAPKAGADKAAKAKDKDKDKDAKGGKDKVAKKGGDTKDAPDAKGGDSAPANNAETMIAGFKAFSEGNLEEAAKNFADDIEWNAIGAPDGSVKGKDKVIGEWGKFRKAFPDLKLTPSRIIDGGDLVVAHYVATGTHKGEFMGVPATDKPIGYETVLFGWFKDGKVTKAQFYPNGVAVMSQIGAMKDAPPVPVAKAPTGAPEVIKGEPNDKNVEAHKKWYASFEGGKVEDMLELCKEEICAEGMVHHDVAEGKTQSTPAEHKENMEMMAKAFPDMKVSNVEIQSVGDWTLATGKGKGTHKGAFGPIKATNKTIDVDFAEISKWENGKMKEAWTFMNPMQMMAQLGLIPAPGGDAVAKK